VSLEQPSGARIAADIRNEAERLADLAAESGLALRLMGGMAVWLTCPSVREEPYRRSHQA
jgi:hypothetical protein